MPLSQFFDRMYDYYFVSAECNGVDHWQALFDILTDAKDEAIYQAQCRRHDY